MQAPGMSRQTLKSVSVWSAILYSILLTHPALFAGIPPGNTASVSVKTEYPEQVNPKSTEPLGDFNSILIPLKRVGHLFLIEARIDGQAGNLIFDTGASGLVLNSTYFRKYASFEKSGGKGITGGSDRVRSIRVNRIDVSGLYYEDISADITDLSHIENRRGVKILGLFGISLIDKFEVEFNAAGNELRLSRTDKQGNRLNEEPSPLKYGFTWKFDSQHTVILMRGTLGEKDLNFCLDSGAESNVIGSTLPRKVLNTVKITRRSSLGGAGTTAVEVLYGTVEGLRFGNCQLGEMETIVTNLGAMSEAYGSTIDGMLGYDFWMKGIFRINFIKNEISFLPAKGDVK
jgi:predicted aspartyl protease